MGIKATQFEFGFGLSFDKIYNVGPHVNICETIFKKASVDAVLKNNNYILTKQMALIFYLFRP